MTLKPTILLRNRRFPHQWLAGACLLVLCVGSSGETIAAEKMPDWQKVTGIVRRHFAVLPGHQPQDLISKSQVQPIFRQLSTLGWKVSDEPAIMRDVLDDSNFLVQELRTPQGMGFMRKLGGNESALGQLDQAARLPGGKLMIKDFIRFENSEKSFDPRSGNLMAKIARLTPDSKKTGNTPTPAEFSEPTGRIYTSASLLERLKKSYDAEKNRRKRVATAR